MRLDKFISNNTAYSRSEASKVVKAERVRVNGELAHSPDQAIKSKKDVITLDDKQIEPIGKLYLMLNKPDGVICANSDGHHATVMDLLHNSENFIGEHCPPLPFKDLQIAGRLDIDTTGMVLITNDGKWNHAVTSPGAACKKVYCVTLKQALDPHVPELFAKGLQLEGEKKKTRPAFIHVITPKKVRLSLSEGKYHQVKRMFAATGNGVKKLHRESIGGINLDGDLAPGQFRSLSKSELETLAKNTEKRIV